MPAMLALFRDCENDTPAGIQRIALVPEVFVGAKVERMTLGRWPRPRTVKLWPAGERLFVAEGIETALAAATRLEYRGALMQPAWASVSGQAMAKVPVARGVNELVLLVDNDTNGIGEKNAIACRERWISAGREVVRLSHQGQTRTSTLL